MIYTAEENEFIIQNYTFHSDKWIADKLGRTASAIRNHRNTKLKLLCKKVVYWHKQPKSIPPDLERRKLFMAMIDLLPKGKYNLNLDKLIPVFGAFENARGI